MKASCKWNLCYNKNNASQQWTPAISKAHNPLEFAKNSIKSPIFSKNFATFVVTTQWNLGLMEKGTRAKLILLCPYIRHNQSWQIFSQRLSSYTNQLFLYMKYVSSTALFAFPCKLLPKSKQHKWGWGNQVCRIFIANPYELVIIIIIGPITIILQSK